MKLLIKLAIIFLLAGTTSYSADAVVRIYAHHAGRASQGSGFFISEDGQVMTAYHVVEGANKIEIIHDELGTFTNVGVQYISSQYDLAVLRIMNTLVSTPYLTLIDSQPRGSDELQVYGYPREGVKQQFRAHPTTNGFVSSHTIRNSRGSRLFNEEINIVPLDVTIYSGMSGGPIVGAGGVIGVLSGSYQEGGTIAWAIPSKYVEEMETIEKMPAEIGQWPALSLMSQSWKNLRASVIINTGALAVYERYQNEVETMAGEYNDMTQYSLQAYKNILVTKPFLQKVIDDPTLGNNMDAANEFIGDALKETWQSTQAVWDASSSMWDTRRRIASSLSGLLAWLIDESGIDDKTGEALVKKVNELNEQYKDIKNGLDATLGIEATTIYQALPKFRQGMQSKVPKEQARAFLNWFNTVNPLLEAYSSWEAMVFIERDISKFRRLGMLFENIVYKAH